MSEMMTDAEIVAEFCTALKAHVDAAREVETNLTKQTVANLFAAEKRVKALSKDALGAALGELDRLQTDNARLRAALEKVGAIVDTCESNKRTGVGHYGRNGGYGSAVADIAEVIRAILDGTE